MSGKKEKIVVRIADLLPQPEQVEVVPGKYLEVHHLTLEQIVKLFWTYQDTFLAIYAEGLNGKPNYEPILLAAPHMVADIIAMGTDAVGQEEDILRLPGTVLLVALRKIWAMSVPDPKKLQESLSGVMAELRRLSSQVRENPLPPEQETSSNPTSQPLSSD